MTRKDYVLIARVIKESMRDTKDGKKIIIDSLVDNMAHELYHDNARFDYNRFAKACGIEE